MSAQQIKGPFGLWLFPILNMILQMMQSRQAGINAISAATPKALPQRIHNEERWEWTDYKGRKREFVIHREVTTE